MFCGVIMINFENVSRYALDNISLHIPKGEAVGLIGASGAGKTTMIKLACGLLSPEKGKIYTLDKDPVLNRKLYKNNVSTFIAGVPLLSRDDTVFQGFELIRNMYGIVKDEFKKRYAELSRRLDFCQFENRTVKELSLGQRMRAELGAALIFEPKLLLFDEPNIGLDENGKAALFELFEERCKNGATVLITSHDMAGISKICGRIALLDGGKLIFYGSVDNLRSRYAPIDAMTVKISGRIPDFDDLPLEKYSVHGNVIKLSYSSNHITSAEIISLILRQTSVSEISIKKPSLENIITQLKKGGTV